MAVAPASGFGYLITGAGLMFRGGLRRFVVVPLLVNTLVFAGAIWAGVAWFEGLVVWTQVRVPAWLQWLEWLLWPVFVLTLLVLVFYTFGLVANLIAAPFNALLAEKVELHLLGRPLDEGGGVAKALRELIPTLFDELRKLVYSLVWAVPFLLLFLVPGVNLAAPVLWFLYTAWMLALQYIDYPMGNHGFKASAIRSRLRRRRLLGLGFGAATAAMTLVPVLNFIVMPSAVAGATALWVRELQEEGPGA
jgi:CysZ protein